MQGVLPRGGNSWRVVLLLCCLLASFASGQATLLRGPTEADAHDTAPSPTNEPVGTPTLEGASDMRMADAKAGSKWWWFWWIDHNKYHHYRAVFINERVDIERNLPGQIHNYRSQTNTLASQRRQQLGVDGLKQRADATTQQLNAARQSKDGTINADRQQVDQQLRPPLDALRKQVADTTSQRDSSIQELRTTKERASSTEASERSEAANRIAARQAKLAEDEKQRADTYEKRRVELLTTELQNKVAEARDRNAATTEEKLARESDARTAASALADGQAAAERAYTRFADSIAAKEKEKVQTQERVDAEVANAENNRELVRASVTSQIEAINSTRDATIRSIKAEYTRLSTSLEVAYQKRRQSVVDLMLQVESALKASQTANASALAANEAVVLETAKLEELRAQLQKEAEEHVAKLEALKKEYEEIKQQAATIDKEQQQMESQMVEAQNAAAAAERDAASANAKTQAAEKALEAELAARQKLADEAKAKQEAAKAALQEAMNAAADAEKQAEAGANERAEKAKELTASVETAKQEAASLEEASKKADEELKAAKEAYSSAVGNADAEYNAALEKAEMARKAQTETARAAISAAQSRESEFTKALEERRKKLADSQSAYQNATRLRQEVETNITNYRVQLLTLQGTLRQEQADLENKIALLEAEKQGLNDQLRRIQENRDAAAAEAFEHANEDSQHEQDLIAKEDELQDMMAANQDAMIKMKALSASNEKLQNHLKQIQDTQKQMTKLTAELKATQKGIVREESLVMKKQQEISGLKDKLQKLQTQLDDHQRTLERRQSLGLGVTSLMGSADEQIASQGVAVVQQTDKLRNEIGELTQRLICLRTHQPKGKESVAACYGGVVTPTDGITTAETAAAPGTEAGNAVADSSVVYFDPNTGKVVPADYQGPKMRGRMVQMLQSM